MQYYYKYKKEDFPLSEFYLESMPFAMFPLISFIFENTDYTVGGGAACNMALNNNGRLKDLDIFIHKDFKTSLDSFFNSSDKYIFWDVNYFGQEKCAIFYNENNLFRKIELTFCDTLLPALIHVINIYGKQFKIRFLPPDNLFFDKLEKIGRKRLNPLPIDKLKNHVNCCIELAKLMIGNVNGSISSDKNIILAEDAIKTVEEYADLSFANELSQVLGQLGLVNVHR